MQTVYLLKDCYKSYLALKKLYNFPDLSTILIIVDKEQAEILLLDKRVKKFPFIINTLPTSIGLIPKIAKVLPLEMFMMLKKFHETNVHQNRILNIPTVTNTFSQEPVKTANLNRSRKNNQIINNTHKNKHKNRPPLIRTVKEDDGSINIILNK
tara:strand:+ start:6255 stop:6716 length:462 start_codon:yes stop_codon:yes gene_type:complete